MTKLILEKNNIKNTSQKTNLNVLNTLKILVQIFDNKLKVFENIFLLLLNCKLFFFKLFKIYFYTLLYLKTTQYQ